jgi:hypothetical protein
VQELLLQPLLRLTSFVASSSFDLTAEQGCSLFVRGEDVFAWGTSGSWACSPRV